MEDSKMAAGSRALPDDPAFGRVGGANSKERHWICQDSSAGELR